MKPDSLSVQEGHLSPSLIFHFVDNMELQFHAREQLIAIRSASRLGYSDLGVNRKLVEQVRAQLRSQDVVK
jgi:uncharacterized protein (DUF1499 family)